MTKEKVLENVMEELDRWVSFNGSGRYVDENFKSSAQINYAIPEDFGIQQIRSEIKEFTSMLLMRPKLEEVLEIGLGYFGSTHFLWRLISDRVTTIDYQQERIRLFGKNTRRFYGKWILDDEKSSFLFGRSNDISTIKKAYSFLKNKVDLLFIDGDHRYESVLTDWLIYSPLVKKGGIVAFHDAISSVDVGVPQFLEEMAKGKIDGKQCALKKIVHSQDLGIAFYEK